MSTSPSAWLVDASIYVFRAWFYRHEQHTDVDGKPTHAVIGFLRFVYNLLQTEQPHLLGFAFDTSLQTSVRKTLYPAYKANRSPAPAELKYQFQLCRDFLDALGIVQAASTQFEADDIVGTWAQIQRQQGKTCRIITGDKDLAQLVRTGDLWWDYGKRKALTDGGVKQTFGVHPVQIPEQLALAGDVADNILGVDGIGMATAAKLLHKFATVEILLSRLPEVGQMKLRGAKLLQSKLTAQQERVRAARQVTEIYCDVPEIPLVLERCPPNADKLQALCERLKLTPHQYQLWLNTHQLS